MSSRTVRLDEEAEQALRDVRRRTGMSISEALKKGLLALRGQVLSEARLSPWDVYERIDLGDGGYAAVPARDAKSAARDVIAGRKRPR